MLDTSPSWTAFLPAIPGSVERSKGLAICQHSMVELPFAAEIAFTLNRTLVCATVLAGNESSDRSRLKSIVVMPVAFTLKWNQDSTYVVRVVRTLTWTTRVTKGSSQCYKMKRVRTSLQFEVG